MPGCGWLERWGLVFLLGICVGCGAMKPVPGGTTGVVRTGADRLADIQVQVYAAASTELLGTGVSTVDGTFALREPGARGPLWLPAGDYRITVESVGPVNVSVPQGVLSAGKHSVESGLENRRPAARHRVADAASGPLMLMIPLSVTIQKGTPCTGD